MMKFVICTVALVIFNSCNSIPLPKVPRGTALSSGMIVDIPAGFSIPASCIKSNPERPQEYDCSEIPKGWQVTSPKGYKVLFDDISAKYLELAKLRSRCVPKRN